MMVDQSQEEVCVADSANQNEPIILDAIYLKNKLVYVTDGQGTDFVTDTMFDLYLQNRTCTPKLCRTFTTKRELLQAVNAL